MKTESLIKSFYGISLLLMMIIIISSVANPENYQFRLITSLFAAIVSIVILIKFRESIKECDEEEIKLCQSLRKDLKNIKGSIALFAGLAVYFFISYHI